MLLCDFFVKNSSGYMSVVEYPAGPVVPNTSSCVPAGWRQVCFQPRLLTCSKHDRAFPTCIELVSSE
jgi:hypothetical protein